MQLVAFHPLKPLQSLRLKGMPWGFRNRLLFSLIAVALLTAGLVGGVGAWQFSRALDSRNQAVLVELARTVEKAIVIEDGAATFDPFQISNLPWIDNIRYRVIKDQQISFEVGGRFPQETTGWQLYQQPLQDGFVLEMASNNLFLQEALRIFRNTTLLTLPVALLAAIGAAYLLFGYLMRPIRRLTGAIHALAQQRFPDPLPIPSGNDELADLAQSFNKMSAAVKGYLERERSFTRYASHELRTPIATMKAQVEAFEAELLSKEESLPEIKRSLGRMEQLLGSLLELSRSPQQEPQPVALYPLVEEVIRSWPQPEQQRIQLSGNPHTSVLGYEHLLQQVFVNLISNALKFSQHTVEVRLLPGSPVQVSVLDGGPGVPPEKMSRLGEPFVRLQPTLPGMGLGLALVRHVVGVVGGSLEFVNRPEGGLEVALSLPAAEVRA